MGCYNGRSFGSAGERGRQHDDEYGYTFQSHRAQLERSRTSAELGRFERDANSTRFSSVRWANGRCI